MIVERLKSSLIIPVLRKVPQEKSAEIVKALYDGGIRAVEITMESEGAEEIIRESVKSYGEKIIVGAGTVLNLDDCKRAIAAGAQFIVSPALDEEVVKYAVEQQVPVIPGVFTPSEMLRAHNAGAAMVKLFPASTVGPGFIKDVKGPLNHISIMTTGGISSETAKAYLDAGAVAIGAGSALLKKDLIGNNDWNALSKEVEDWFEKLN
ncbi:bifunctional 4-hydroxy-2-oxoglutarate aldolase/2-dehydro-3-deoxy-phosphogluconate aldolase [Planococcus beigongshangi]|uniref:bifunctional 4-hydroxy-2-oxoglutarate aldolase/2-dehydro-3-deoxy-phosphogluconate aldolase n=1 Tax=Planococcus beigongshangi TaxID=2782536 RepID=UPI00193BD007|nr:bifunctional 4-hydroxy-2-oxoglutarate aldolase/2-dehydro-3-deoxy-phosphogluconate aldolase [Planococcus beigongshangi]